MAKFQLYIMAKVETLAYVSGQIIAYGLIKSTQYTPQGSGLPRYMNTPQGSGFPSATQLPPGAVRPFWHKRTSPKQELGSGQKLGSLGAGSPLNAVSIPPPTGSMLATRELPAYTLGPAPRLCPS